MDTARLEDINGWYEIKGNPLSKVGVFDYLGSSIDATGAMGLEPNKIYKVYRSEESLSDPEAIDSFKLVPWIDDHTMLGDNYTPPEDKGVQGTVGEDVYYDTNDKTLKGNIKVFSKSLKEKIDNGKKELSCGYRCKYSLESGVYDGQKYDIVQTDIRGNHLALVEEGRMGPDVAVLDGGQRETFSIDSKEFVKMADEAEKKTEDMEEGKAADMSPEEMMEQVAELAGAVSELKEMIEAMAGNGDGEDMEEDEEKESEDMEEDKTSMDASVVADLAKSVKTLGERVEGLATDGFKNFMKQAGERDALAQAISHHVGAFDHAEMTLQEVAAYGVEKVGLDGVEKGHEVTAIKSFLHSRPVNTTAFVNDSADSKTNISSIAKFKKGGAA